jgi:hypothetical protein
MVRSVAALSTYEQFHAIVATNCGLPDCPVS